MVDMRDVLDDIFLVQKAAVEGKGEDSFFGRADQNIAVVSVFDGCGGLGAKAYEQLSGRTGAYIASRTMSGVLNDWFELIDTSKVINREYLLASMRDAFMEAYKHILVYNEGSKAIKGSMVRDFPTTAAIAVLQIVNNRLVLHVVWAGDSRVYLMDDEGLAQLTVDDLEAVDTMDNLYEDAALTNILSADGNFKLNYHSQYINKPTMVFAATDGCFGYLPSPMHFEKMILDAFAKSDSPQVCREYLNQMIEEVTGDDYALCAMSIGYGDFMRQKESLRNRFLDVKQKYINPLGNDNDRIDEALLRRLWGKYRQSYERYMGDNKK